MAKINNAAPSAPPSALARAAKQMWRDKILYLMLAPTLIYFIIFRVWPIMNMRLAFFDYKARGPWVFAGLKYFKMLFKTPAFMEILRNTLILSFMKYVLLFPFFVIFARFACHRAYFSQLSKIVKLPPYNYNILFFKHLQLIKLSIIFILSKNVNYFLWHLNQGSLILPS